MKELGLEAISGTPGTSATLTLTAVTSPIAFPRLSQVALIGEPTNYTIESSTGQPIATGIGHSTAVGGFIRDAEYSQWDGTTFVSQPSTLANLPAGAVIYCSLAQANTGTLRSRFISGTYFEPGGIGGNNAGFTPSASNRDHWWRIENKYPFEVSAICCFLASSAILDVGIYSVNPVDGKPGVLLAGWNNVSGGAGWNTLLMSAKTLGVLPAASAKFPVGDLYAMANLSAGSFARGVWSAAISGSGSTDSVYQPQPLLYAARTAGTTFASFPGCGRHTDVIGSLPALSFQAA